MKRPRQFDVCFIENDILYASNTYLGGVWMGGLFTKIDIHKNQPLCQYTGKILTKNEELSSSSEYLMKVSDPKDRRRKLTIDGDPSKFNNISAYANYTDNKYANAIFIDQTKKNEHSNITLIAKEFIPKGTEIRVDYDMGSSAHPFRDMMIQKGIYNHDDCKTYKQIKWQQPSHLSI
jgi:hypothetical protein